MNPVVFVCTSHGLGGLELNMVNLASWMSRAGRPVTFVAGEGEPLALRASAAGLTVRTVKRRSRYLDLPAAIRLRSIADEANAPQLLVSTTPDIDLAVVARGMSGQRLQVSYLQQMPLAPKRDPIHTWKYRNLRAWIAPLPYLADMARERTHMPQERIHVVPLCIELERFTGNPLSVPEARAMLELPVDGLWFGVIGRVDPQKGMHTAVAAFTEVASSVPEAHLLLMGEPTRGEGDAYARELEAQIAASPMRDRIVRRPFRPDVETAYRALDVFLMASKAEPFGMVTVEAMASGCAVIGTRAGGTVDLLEHGALGPLVTPEDPHALAVAMQALAADPVQRERLQRSGRSAVAQHYAHTVQVTGVGALLDA